MYTVKIVTPGLRVLDVLRASLPGVVEWAAERLDGIPSYHALYRSLRKSPLFACNYGDKILIIESDPHNTKSLWRAASEPASEASAQAVAENPK